jgi:hypothetical protein
MTLFGFLVLVLIAAAVIHVNQTKSVQPPPVPQPTPEPQKPVETPPRMCRRYYIAAIITLILVIATLVEILFWS